MSVRLWNFYVVGPKNQDIWLKINILNFDAWMTNHQIIGHDFGKKKFRNFRYLEIILTKYVKKCASKPSSLIEKKSQNDSWHKKFTLKLAHEGFFLWNAVHCNHKIKQLPLSLLIWQKILHLKGPYWKQIEAL